MNCVQINLKTVIIFISLIFRNLNIADTSKHKPCVNDTKCLSKPNINKEIPSSSFIHNFTTAIKISRICSSNLECYQLKYPCIECKLDYNCVYGEVVNVTCRALDEIVKCNGKRTFTRPMTCRYCYQTEEYKEHICEEKNNCRSVASPKEYYQANCTVKNSVICLGKRQFLKRKLCNWTNGYKWKTALILSFAFGGFGIDRFYLGHWQEGIGKLMSFGGLGIWTLIDAMLIGLHYLGPVDGSLYI